ncbi:MAG TPA: replication factor A [Methanosarcinales archaeon]|nr:replication factor A [Methanosarcinales archaeon]
MDDQEIMEIYEKLKGIISEEEFFDKIEEKVTLLGGLCDKKTAASLVLHDLGIDDSVKKISTINYDDKKVSFIGKVLSVSRVREFKKSNGSIGRVANIKIGDDTGTIRLNLWNEKADLVKKGKIKIGQNLRVSGTVREGYYGIEVNIGRSDSIELIKDDIFVDIKTHKIKDIVAGKYDLNVIGKVLDIGIIRTFNRSDGSEGKVGSLTLGDDTGKIRVTLWDNQTEFLKDIKIGDVIEIVTGYSRENDFTGKVEINVGSNSTINKSNKKIDYSENITKIADIGINEYYSVEGVVTGLEEKHEFEKKDGSIGVVANIYISDETGRIKVVLWGDHAKVIDDIDIGNTKLQIIDCYSKTGRNDEIELSAGYGSIIEILENR